MEIVKKEKDLNLTNTVIIKEFPSGSISLNKDDETSSGLFQPLSRGEDEKEGTAHQFFVNGLPRLKASINKVQFNDGDAYLSLNRNFAGSEWMWDQFNKRLNLGIYSNQAFEFVNLKMPKLKKGSTQSRTSSFTWQNIDPSNFDKEVGIPNAESLLEDNGVKIGKKSDILAESPTRDGYVAYWEIDNDLAPGLVYFILAFLPIAISSSAYSKPEIVVVDEPVLTRETMFYTLDELLSAGEKDTIECKSSMYFSAKSKTPPTVVNHEIIRAIVGMLNAKGGTLLIGVSEDKDSKNYIKKGIKSDFEWMEYAEEDPKWLKRMGPLSATWEDYQKVLRKEIMDRIGRTYFNSCIVINFEDIGFGKENPVARIDIEPAPQPASDRSGNRHIRFANGTQLLPKDQEDEYFRDRFPHLEDIERDVNNI